MISLNQPMRMGPYGSEAALNYKGFFVPSSVTETSVLCSTSARIFSANKLVRRAPFLSFT